MITAEDLEKLLAEHEQAIKHTVIDEVTAQIKKDITWELNTQISAIVKKFLNEDIAPEIRATLVESKPVILEAVANAAVVIGQLLTNGLVEDAQKKMKDSYGRRGVIKALFE